MFSLDQGDELVFQIQINNPNPEQQVIQQDFVMDQAAASSQGGNKRHGKDSLSMSKDDIKEGKMSKKIMHRELERQRRQEMSKLHGSLRSLLPLEFIKGKRSISDHMQQTVNYINHLQGSIKELHLKRDELNKNSKKIVTDPGNGGTSNLCLLDDNNDIHVTVTLCFCGVEIIITRGLMEEKLFLSRVMEILIQDEQLNVTSCASTRVNDRLVHTIRAEGNDPTSINISELQQKLCAVIINI